MEMQQTTTIVAGIPASGWYARYTDNPGREILCWALTSEGDAFGLVVSGDSVLPAFAVSDGFAEYVHEDELIRK
jgi:hypothetical protein